MCEWVWSEGCQRAMAWMYILECSDGSYYVGSTRDLEVRLWQHQAGLGAQYTKRRLPVKLVFSSYYENVAGAYGVGKHVQGWSRAKRQALIRADFAALPGLSKRHRKTNRAG